ncbi:MAG: VOC family protein [Pseudomonadota bacterium]
MSNVIKRTTLIVRDIQRSIDWYQQVLGMSIWMETDFELSGEGLAAGKKGDKTRLAILKCEDPVIGMIGLLQWIDPPLPAPEEIPRSVSYGNPTFVVATDDAEAIFKAATDLGTHVYCPPRPWSTKGHDGRTKHFIGVSVFDPDGYFYECNQVVDITD